MTAHNLPTLALAAAPLRLQGGAATVNTGDSASGAGMGQPFRAGVFS